MATQLLTKGPLSSALGQWILLGCGTFVIFTGDNGVSRAAQEVASIAFRLATGRDVGSGPALLREAALGFDQQQPQQQPIVIHSVSSPSSEKNGWAATVIKLSLGAGSCWAAYVVFSNLLPDQIKEMLPVTRKFFESAVSSLGQGIIRVREALGEQIALLGHKQDELSSKQDATHDQVLGIKGDIGDVRLHIDDISMAISRCENSLTDAAGRQNYMSRGVRLLVQCVGDLLRSSDPRVAEELDQFSKLSVELMNGEGGDYHRGESSGRLDHYPSSPNLSEIGSTTSNMRRSHSPPIMPNASAPTSNSKDVNYAASPPPLLGMGISRSTPPSLRMLSRSTSYISNGGTPLARSNTNSSNGSGPEDEVPGPAVRFEDMNVDEKLRFIGGSM